MAASVTASTSVGRAGLELRRDDVVDRQLQPHAALLGLGRDRPRAVEAVVLDQRLADRHAARLEEGVGHGAADQQRVDLVEQVVDDLDLVRDLRAADDRDKRAVRMFYRVAQILQLLLHQEAGRAFADGSDDPVHRRVCPMGRPERVVDVEVGQLGELPGKNRVVFLLRGVEAQVLQQHDMAAGVRLGHRRFGGIADAVGGEHDRPAEQRRQRARPAAAG